MLSARNVMNPQVIHIERGTSIKKVTQIMIENHVGSIIVTAGGFPVGILTETDVAKTIADGKNPNETVIEDIMSSPLFSTSPDADITQIANTMSINKIKKMPVVENQRVIGIITQTDIIKHILRVCSHVHEQYSKGKVVTKDFMTCSAEMFNSVRSSIDHKRNWHMRCADCGHRFLAEEEHGKLLVENCPRCHGHIDYDPTPPL